MLQPIRREKKCRACPTRFVPTRPLQGSKRTAVGSVCAACHQAREQRKAIREAKQCSL